MQAENFAAVSCCMFRWMDLYCHMTEMCHKGKCCFCIPVERGCLALGILSAIANGVAFLAVIVYGILLGHELSNSNGTSPDYLLLSPEARASTGLAMGAILTAAAGVAMLGLIFSALLCNGICKRRPGQVKSFFIFGVSFTILCVLAALTQLSVDDDPIIGIMVLGGAAIYSLFLVLVYHTYNKICEDIGTTNHIRLVEEYAT